MNVNNNSTITMETFVIHFVTKNLSSLQHTIKMSQSQCQDERTDRVWYYLYGWQEKGPFESGNV